MIGSSSPDLIKRPDTSARLYSAVMNSGGVTAEVLGEPLDIGGDPVVGGGGPLLVRFQYPFAEERALCIVISQSLM